MSKTKVEQTKLKEKKKNPLKCGINGGFMNRMTIVSNREKAEEADINGHDPTVLGCCNL